MDEGDDGQSWTEEALQLVKILSTEITLRLSNFLVFLYHHKIASLIGAIAGTALAIVFAWTYLKPPNERHRRPRKRRGSSSTSDDSQAIGEATSSSSICHPSSSQYGVATQGWTALMKINLAQVIRRQLNGGRKITCQLLGVVFMELNPEELQEHAVVRPSVVETLMEIAKACDLYLMARVLDDESEERVLTALDEVGVFKICGLNRNKVLFCSTESGKTSFVRQLEPDWHIDTDAEKISQLSRFIRYQLHICPVGSQNIASNVFSSVTLEHYFGCLDQR